MVDELGEGMRMFGEGLSLRQPLPSGAAQLAFVRLRNEAVAQPRKHWQFRRTGVSASMRLTRALSRLSPSRAMSPWRSAIWLMIQGERMCLFEAGLSLRQPLPLGAAQLAFVRLRNEAVGQPRK